jgi:hypothetical protein
MNYVDGKLAVPVLLRSLLRQNFFNGAEEAVLGGFGVDEAKADRMTI